MMMDLFAEMLMEFNGKQIYIHHLVDYKLELPVVANLPTSTAVPIAEAAAFYLVFLYALRTQRYIILPLSMAALYANRTRLPNEVQETLNPHVAAKTAIQFLKSRIDKKN